MSRDLGYYPGSSRPREPKSAPAAAVADPTWDANPRTYTVNGKPVEFFTVGALAMALGRRPVTIRKWERTGVIPEATFRAPSDDVRGQRRLYSREQVEGMITLAAQEGLLPYDPMRPRAITTTAFTERVLALFERLAA